MYEEGSQIRRSSKSVKSNLVEGYGRRNYKNEYFNYEYLKRTNIDSRDVFFEFLWRDTDLGKKKPDDLPLTRYFGAPFGWMIARTGWDVNSVIAEMKINEYNFLNHQHHDAGSFQIYYKGPLGLDSGMYQGSSGGYNSPHNKNYFKRTIAHNSLLIYDPNEKFETYGYGGSDKTKFATNDGGQRLPGKEWSPPRDLNVLLNEDYKTGEILAHGVGSNSQTPDYSYLKGDISDAYSDKVKEVKRSFTFLNLDNKKTPAVFIVFDKIVSNDASFKKFWLLHSIEEPTVDGNEFIIERTKNGDTGKLHATTLLPAVDDLQLTTIGGPGKEFWVFGENYQNVPIKRPDIANERGAWRVEVSPKIAKETDYFLNVIQVTDTKNKNQLEVIKIESKKVIGIQIADRVVIYSNNFSVLAEEFSFEIKGKSTYKVLLTDLKEGVWKVFKNGKQVESVKVNAESGTLYFVGEKGNYSISK